MVLKMTPKSEVVPIYSMLSIGR